MVTVVILKVSLEAVKLAMNFKYEAKEELFLSDVIIESLL